MKPRPLSALEDYTLKSLESMGHMSLLYILFVSKCKESSQNVLQLWRTDLQNNSSEEEWSEACSLVQTPKP